MAKKTKDITIPNPIHHIGSNLSGPNGTLNAMGYGTMISLAIVFSIYGNNEIDTTQIIIRTQPDSIGTENANTIINNHKEQLSSILDKANELKKQTLEQTFSEKSNSNEEDHRTKLKEFNEITLQTLFNLYTSGASDTEAAISEQDFQKLHHELMDITSNYVDLKSINYDPTIVHSGMLDECILQTDMPDNPTNIEQFNTMNKIKSCMTDAYHSENNKTLGNILITAFAPLLIFTLFSTLTAKRMANTPKRITLKKAKIDH